MEFAKKSLGQNFLIDKNIISKIINLVDIKNKDVIEIGPGKGSLTEAIIKKKPKTLSLIEKDSKLAEKLNLKFSQCKNIKVYNTDILRFNLEKIVTKDSIIFGNLPYNISSHILVKTLKFKKWPPSFKHIIFMFQKELGERILGKYKTNKYGRLSILTNFRFKAFKKFLVSPNCFFPRPKITSMVILFEPRKASNSIKNISNLEKVTNFIFSNKRKMVNKSLKRLFGKKKVDKLHFLNLNSRPSEISPEVYYQITEIFEKK